MWGNLDSSGSAKLYQIVSRKIGIVKMSGCVGAADFWFTIQGGEMNVTPRLILYLYI